MRALRVSALLFLALATSCRAPASSGCSLECAPDGNAWNTCDTTAPFRTCRSWERCVDGTGALTGQASCQEYVEPEIGALLTYVSAPDQFIRAVFPHHLYTHATRPSDGCDTYYEPVPEPGTPTVLQSVTVADVILANPATDVRTRIPLGTIDDRSPFYLALQPGNYDADVAAGQTLEFRITGSGSVPSLTASFVIPSPIHDFSPFPHGSGRIDFGRAEGFAVQWDPGTVSGDVVAITLVGVDAAQPGGRRLICYPADDGDFTVPSSALLQMAPGSVTVGIQRFQESFIETPGLSGNGSVSATAPFIPVDPLTGTGIPLVYQID